MPKKEEKVKTIFEFIIGAVVSAGIIYYTFVSLGKIDLSLLFTSRFNWFAAVLSAVVFDFSTVTRGFVYTFGIDPSISWLKSWRITACGNAANMVLPFKMGEGLRLTLFPKGYSAGRILRLTVFPSLFDMAAMFGLSAVSALLAGFKDAVIETILRWALVVVIVLLLMLLVAMLISERVYAAVRRRLNRDTLKMALWVLLSWVLLFLSVWLGFLSFGYGFSKGTRYTLAAFASMNLITLVPVSPGGIGLFEYSVVLGLTGVGAAASGAKTAGVLLHCIQYAALLPLGLVLYILGFIPPLSGPLGRGTGRKAAAGARFNVYRKRKI